MTALNYAAAMHEAAVLAEQASANIVWAENNQVQYERARTLTAIGAAQAQVSMAWSCFAAAVQSQRVGVEDAPQRGAFVKVDREALLRLVEFAQRHLGLDNAEMDDDIRYLRLRAVSP